MRVHTFLTIVLASSLSLLSMRAQDAAYYTRGIGIYPGNPSESFAPIACIDSSSITNVALHRLAIASSSYDYNLTAHLVTDGIIHAKEPVRLVVTTPSATLPRREAEWTVDGGTYSANTLLGDTTWLQYEWTGGQTVEARQVVVEGRMAYDEHQVGGGYRLACQVSDDGDHWITIGTLQGEGFPGQPTRYRLHTDPNKQTEEGSLPTRLLQETIPVSCHQPFCRFRILMEMKGAVQWAVHSINFIGDDGKVADVMPSNHFSSAWMSGGGGEQWIYVDLGIHTDISQVITHWIEPPRKASIEVSDDATTWTKVAALSGDTASVKARGRYVRLLLTQTGEKGYYALSEFQVMGSRHLTYQPHPQEGLRDGRFFLSGGQWRLQRASEVEASGEVIADNVFDDSHWVPATVPATVLSSYVNIGAIPHPNYADYVDQISESFFRSDFWYRDEFEVPDDFGLRQTFLHFDGINWKAEVYLNGCYLGPIEGAFMRGHFNVSGILRKGKNVLAVKVHCNEHFGAVKEKDEFTTQFNGGILGADNPTFHASVGWDWITTVRGREVGIWNEVYLTESGVVTVADPYVRTHRIDDSLTEVTPSVFVTNHAATSVSGTLTLSIGQVVVSQQVTLPANGEQEVCFTPALFPQLASKAWQLWWPNGYGEPFLYDAKAEFVIGGMLSDRLDFKAGLREMTYVDMLDSLRIFINGRRFVPLGGNWGVDEHNLNYRAREYDVAVGYHRQMNCTMIRNWVGQVGDEAFYEACDRHGIMVWQDFWLANPADGPDPYDDALFLSNARDYLKRIRRYASIGLYCGRNEGAPPSSIDKCLRQYVRQLSPGLGYIPDSADDGVSGHGPYQALPASEYFRHQTGKIHSERGMPNVMNWESLQRTFSPDSLWPQSREWGQHDYTLNGAQRAASFNNIIRQTMGDAQTASQFATWAQWVNYNGYRAMFEATSASRAGLLIWMSHPCWPSMVWQTYDYYFEPTAAFFGMKKACETLHVQYNPLSNSVELVNRSAGEQKSIVVVAEIYNLKGRRLWRKTKTCSSLDDSTIQCFGVESPGDKEPVWILRLYAQKGDAVVSENIYHQYPEKGSLHAITELPEAELQVDQSISDEGTRQNAVLLLRNTSRVPAVFVRIVLKGDDGEQILPVDYSDNYLTIMPGEKREVAVSWKKADSRGKTPVFTFSSLNASQ